jgi:hypothetical protein
LVHHKRVLHYSHSVHKVSHPNSTVVPCRIYNKGYYSTQQQCDAIWSVRYGETCYIFMSEDVVIFYGTLLPTYTTIWHNIPEGIPPPLWQPETSVSMDCISLCNQLLTAKAVFLGGRAQHKHKHDFLYINPTGASRDCHSLLLMKQKFNTKNKLSSYLHNY